MNSKAILRGKHGRYTIENPQPFAFGRMSVLLEASDAKGERVCVKQFRSSPRTLGGQNLVDEFVREQEAHKKLTHPHILPLIDYGGTSAADSGPFLILPMCKGGNLRTIKENRDFLPLAEALAVLQQVAIAIDFAHKRGFIHGDIKPENVLFQEDISHAYLSDFGMSKYFGVKERITYTYTHDYTIAFTGGGATMYLSPEQIQDGEVSTRSDIYSLAIVAYEVLTGHLPFDVKVPPFRQMQAKILGDVINPRDANPTLSEATSSALLKGLAVDRKDRPETAVWFCESLAGKVDIPRQRKRSPIANFWSSLSPVSKVAIVAAVIAAVATILAAVIGIIPDLLKSTSTKP